MPVGKLGVDCFYHAFFWNGVGDCWQHFLMRHRHDPVTYDVVKLRIVTVACFKISAQHRPAKPTVFVFVFLCIFSSLFFLFVRLLSSFLSALLVSDMKRKLALTLNIPAGFQDLVARAAAYISGSRHTLGWRSDGGSNEFPPLDGALALGNNAAVVVLPSQTEVLSDRMRKVLETLLAEQYHILISASGTGSNGGTSYDRSRAAYDFICQDLPGGSRKVPRAADVRTQLLSGERTNKGFSVEEYDSAAEHIGRLTEAYVFLLRRFQGDCRIGGEKLVNHLRMGGEQTLRAATYSKLLDRAYWREVRVGLIVDDPLLDVLAERTGWVRAEKRFVPQSQSDVKLYGRPKLPT